MKSNRAAGTLGAPAVIGDSLTPRLAHADFVWQSRPHGAAPRGGAPAGHSDVDGAEYVSVAKSYRNNRRLTTVSVTAAGRGAFADYLALLEQIVRDARQK
ncbi:MAG: hypothetical protein EHM24_07610 [Acidobacteria bacterium]|nr:MAG: hypothetical protein EHM24_21030 [Acidobacteriota bacterium]RPJ73619.1 MAG: hypothetical protein EHM24_07610 [Acidobacteriota bacterium]